MSKKSDVHPATWVAIGAVIATAFLSSYLPWRRADKARQLAKDDHLDRPQPQPLEALTVTELRRKAADQEIDGRSSMNKKDLVSALKD